MGKYIIFLVAFTFSYLSSMAQNDYVFYQTRVETEVEGQPSIEFILTLPNSVKSFSEVENVIAFCSWSHTPEGLKNAIRNRSQFVVNVLEVAERHKLAILTWATSEYAWKLNSGGKNYHELSDEEQKPYDENFKKVADAWETGMKRLITNHGIPSSGYLLYGVSAGGQWAHRLALRKPEYFSAVHLHICTGYDKPTEAGKSIFWFLSAGDLDPAYEHTKLFYQDTKAMGYSIVFLPEKNVGHEMTQDTVNMSNAWFDFIMENKGKPQQIKNAIENPPLYGNPKSMIAVPAKNKELIPEKIRLPIPARQLAVAWGSIEE